MMKYFGLWAALSAATLPISGFAQSLKMQFGGVARTYILHVPTGVAANPPLMFVLCGHGMTGADQERDTKMDGISDREKFIVVYPDPIAMNWDQAGTSDFKFFVALIDTIDAKYHIDRNRVYAAGFSQGAGMTHGVGCGYADKFAAIAPTSGNIPATCSPARAIPMFLTFGTGTDIASPATFMSSASKWATLDECPSTPTVTRPYPVGKTRSVVTRISWGPCKNGTQVIADSIQGGPHEWPMDTVTKVNNSEEVWSFFKKFTLGGTTALPRLAAAHPSFRATYANGIVRVQGTGERTSVRILDHQGRLVAEGPAGRDEIEFRGKPAGVYRVLISGNGGTGAVKLVIP